MTTKEAFKIAKLAGLFLVLELALYWMTGMPRALKTATPAFAVAYQFQWLIVLTFAAGIFAPLSAWIEQQSRKRDTGLFCWAIFVGLAMILFTTFSFLKVSSTLLPLSPQGAAEKQKAGARKISEGIQFVGSHVNLVDPETIKIDLRFQNRFLDEFTELDYIFVALEEATIFYRIKIRQPVHIPSHGRVVAALTWKKANFKDPAPFNRLRDAYTKKTLRIFAKPSRAIRIDGKAIED